MILIDPPSPFAPTEEWEDFLVEMEERLKDDPTSVEVKDAIAEAKEALGQA